MSAATMARRHRPVIANPYPTFIWHRISDFRYFSRLDLGREPESLKLRGLREASYITIAPYTVEFMVDDTRQRLTVPAGMLTDLASVPRVALALVDRVGPHLEAAIVHDFLYIAWQLLPGRKAMKADWRFANEVMFAGMKAARVNWFQRNAIEAALRSSLISWPVFKGRDDGSDGAGLFVTLDA